MFFVFLLLISLQLSYQNRTSENNENEHPTGHIIIDEVEQEEIEEARMERARGLSPEAVESNIRARYPLRPWFVSGPYGAGPSGLGQSGGVPAHSNVHYFESSVLDVNSAVENAPAGSLTPRANVLGNVNPWTIPLFRDMANENSVFDNKVHSP
uniref:Uncharacterized protein n=1 Tax=Meloidogyne javanica TaxID=6303 RepID=A0A915LKL0_MELJA